MNKNLLIALVVSAAMIETSGTFAQEPSGGRSTSDRGPGGFPSFVNPDPTVTLLKVPEVQTELKLEQDKAKKLDEISAEITRERARLNAEYSAKMNELNKKAEGEALNLLSDAQRRRTEQLRLQQQGLRALGTNQVAEKLGLSQEQRSKIASLNNPRTNFVSGRDQGGNTTPPNSNLSNEERLQQWREASTRRAAETREKILAVLTPEQKTKWSELTGEAFQFPTRQRTTTRGTRPSTPTRPETEKKDQ